MGEELGATTATARDPIVTGGLWMMMVLLAATGTLPSGVLTDLVSPFPIDSRKLWCFSRPPLVDWDTDQLPARRRE
jgi:hypothetical protein